MSEKQAGFPTLYLLDADGEAHTALHFCTVHCREEWLPGETEAYDMGNEPLTISGEVCNWCGVELEAQ